MCCPASIKILPTGAWILMEFGKFRINHSRPDSETCSSYAPACNKRCPTLPLPCSLTDLDKGAGLAIPPPEQSVSHHKSIIRPLQQVLKSNHKSYHRLLEMNYQQTVHQMSTPFRLASERTSVTACAMYTCQGTIIRVSKYQHK